MVAAKLHWMPFFGDDFYGDRNVQVMSLETQALYLQLLWFSWREGGLPRDMDDLANIVRIPKAHFAKKHWPKLSPCWKQHPDEIDILVNPRLEDLRREQKKAAEKKSKAARRAAGSRWQKEQVDA